MNHNKVDADEIKRKRILQHWLLGSNTPLSLEEYPEDWQPILRDCDEGNEQIITALALMSHYQTLTEHAVPHKPLLDEKYLLQKSKKTKINQKLTRFILTLIEHDTAFGTSFSRQALYFVASHDMVVSPAVFFKLPKRIISDVPPIYEEWKRWYLFNEVKVTEKNLSHLKPEVRNTLFREMRKTSPEETRKLIESRLNQGDKFIPIGMLKSFLINLTREDITLLEKLTNSTSKKHKEIIESCFTKLGNYNNRKAKQLIEYCQTEFSYYRKKSNDNYSIYPKNANPHDRDEIKNFKRIEPFNILGLEGIAYALSISIDQLIEYWDFEKNFFLENKYFINAATRCSEEIIQKLFNRIIHIPNKEPEIFKNLFEHLSNEAYTKLILNLLYEENYDFIRIGSILKKPLDGKIFTWEKFRNLSPWKEIASQANYMQYRPRRSSAKEQDNFLALGFLLPSELAEHLLQEVNSIFRTIQSDYLVSLQLNVELSKL